MSPLNPMNRGGSWTRLLSGAFVLVLLCESQAEAQETSWGVKGGMNLSTLGVSNVEPKPEFDYRLGLVAGGFFTWPLGSRLDLQPEALFSQQGASFDTFGTSTIKTDYFVTPILVRYKLKSSGRGLVLFAGPSLGFKLSANATSDFGGTSVTEDIGDEIEGFDYGVVFGAGWEAGRLSIDGRYTWGLSRLGVDEDEAGSQKTTHRVVGILAGVRF